MAKTPSKGLWTIRTTPATLDDQSTYLVNQTAKGSAKTNELASTSGQKYCKPKRCLDQQHKGLDATGSKYKDQCSVKLKDKS